MVKPRRNQWVTSQGFWNHQLASVLDSLSLSYSTDGYDLTPGVERRTRTATINPDSASQPLFEAIQTAVMMHNAEYYGFRLAYMEPLLVHEYHPGGLYTPHQDWGGMIDPKRPELCRKLSFSIQLSDPGDYEGGDLEFNTGEPWSDEYRSQIRSQGTLISWPGFVLHGVTPVTRGVRRSLVGFCVGPDFQ
jgi:PKHD-type hydroxylase